MNAYQGTAGMEVHRLSGAIAAEVTGVDLAKLDGEQFEAIRKAFLEHCVLVIRGQHLSPEELLEFSRRWGDISITPMLNYIDGCPGLFQVDNVGKDRGVTENWHSDSSFIPAPPAIDPRDEHAPWQHQYFVFGYTESDGDLSAWNGQRPR